MADLFDPMTLTRGPAMKNRFMLAPLTNLQSHPDGRMSDDEFRWLTKRAEGDFGLTMTCAAHVQAVGQGFPGQMGVFGDQHLEGLTRLAAAIKAAGSVSCLQLHHAGNRSPKDLVGQAVCPSDDPGTGARGLSTGEVEQLIEDFIAAAVRAERAGFEGSRFTGPTAIFWPSSSRPPSTSVPTAMAARWRTAPGLSTRSWRASARAAVPTSS